MKFFFRKYIGDLVWILVTLIIIATASIAQMYSRSMTIDKVIKNNFEIVYNLLNTHSEIDKKELRNILEPLIGSTGYALFHAAIITKDNSSCIENTKHFYNRPLLCPIFKDSKTLTTILDIPQEYTKPLERESTYISPDEKVSQSYLFHKFTNSNEWLVAKANFLSEASEFKTFQYFLTHRYIDANGYKKIFEKGKFLGAIILFFSFLIWLGFKIYQRKQNSKYIKLKKIEEELHKKWQRLDEDLNETKNAHYEKVQEIEELEAKLRNETEQEQLKLNKIIKELKSSKYELDKRLKEQEKEIIRIEESEKKQRIESNKQFKKLDCTIKELESAKVNQKFDKLELLWRHELNWNDRKTIEALVALKDTHLPFTITQGFIAFDKLIFELIKNNFPDINYRDIDLYTGIDLTTDNNLLPSKYKKGAHDIRKARNKWFHAGIYPKRDIIENMINILQNVDAKPII